MPLKPLKNRRLRRIVSLRKLRRLRRDNVAKFLNLSNLPISPISDRTCGRAPILPILPIQPIPPIPPIHPQKTHKKKPVQINGPVSLCSSATPQELYGSAIMSAYENFFAERDYFAAGVAAAAMPSSARTAGSMSTMAASS